MFARNAGTIMLALILTGCNTVNELLPPTRYGPPSTPLALAIEESAARETSAVNALVRASGYERPAATNNSGWYYVILAGFNIVDDACMAYIDDLWVLERRKARNNTIITAAGAATAAIIGALPNPSASTLTTLAQAFGLAAILNNTIIDTYLYNYNAATVKKLVRKTMGAYRDDLANNVMNNRSYVVGPEPGVYHHMREYLSLCLPPTIQGQIEDLVAQAKAGPETASKAVTPAGAAPAPFGARSPDALPRASTRIVVGQ
jgi:hypothetical protein